MNSRTAQNLSVNWSNKFLRGDGTVNYADLMQEKQVFFAGLTEPEENSLRLYFHRTKTVPEPLVLGDKVYEDAETVVVDTNLPLLIIEFQSYIGYSIRNESFTSWDTAEEFEGRAFRIYTKSKYLDFIRVSTLASEEYPGPFKHYGMSCLSHVVDVVSASEPVVKEVWNGK